MNIQFLLYYTMNTMFGRVAHKCAICGAMAILLAVFLSWFLHIAHCVHPSLRLGAKITEKAKHMPDLRTYNDVTTYLGAAPGDYTAHHVLYGILPQRYSSFGRGFTNLTALPDAKVAIWDTDELAIGVIYNSKTGQVLHNQVEPTSATPVFK